ncbi:uncharacterized protein BDW47DRAFT_104877 [Aspergillus candidus]|uniref:Uncharacterized protein n=1 Tax=Aspergillus candidus TaxID=41067 RepID=A0A2I2FCU7_ASPCN|nr:hypothetical protein BDW47DRAFT_104877 [Aspergillus candidus]PLB38460.1 hypothetical protein BDW47DRAFT_104877 [Aspergillus candidus]
MIPWPFVKFMGSSTIDYHVAFAVKIPFGTLDKPRVEADSDMSHHCNLRHPPSLRYLFRDWRWSCFCPLVSG